MYMITGNELFFDNLSTLFKGYWFLVVGAVIILILIFLLLRYRILMPTDLKMEKAAKAH